MVITCRAPAGVAGRMSPGHSRAGWMEHCPGKGAADCKQRSFVEAGTTMKGSFAEDKEGAKLKVKLNGLGELQKK